MSENKQDTITVELPIEAIESIGDSSVRVLGMGLTTRDRWREIAADPVGADTSALTAHIAPAVVAWIERDEWKPLDLPEVGRTIKATLRNGRVETFEVTTANDYGDGWVFLDAGYAIEREFDEGGRDRIDIIAWEYVDEPAESVLSAQDIRRMAHTLQCIVNDLGRVAK